MPFDINTRFEGLPFFETPFELLMYFDEELLEGDFAPHDWQIEIMQKFGRELKPNELVREALNANNGSGKSQFCLAPCAVWLAACFPEALCCVTSSSHKQMNDQTERYIRALCQRMNDVLREDYPEGFWKINQGAIKGLANGSFIDLFVTDEAGKFEGRHPIRMGRRFGFFFDECKSVAEELFDAAYRCNGMSHRLDQSSPGEMVGHFYDTIIDDDPDSPWNTYTVTVFDCPHLNPVEANELIRKKGRNDPLVRSSLFAEFTAKGSHIVISRESMNENNRRWLDAEYKKATRNLFDEPRAGLDLAAGGDEIVLDVWHGTEQLGIEAFHMRDTTRTVTEIISMAKNYPNLKAEKINADDGGVGRGIIDQLHKKGWEVERVLNQWAPNDKTRYYNLGTEMWFEFKRFVEEGHAHLVGDKKQIEQLVSRYYKIQQQSGKLILESKIEAKKNGHGSPDRGDACVLAWRGYTYPMNYMEPAEKKLEGMELDELLTMLAERRRGRSLTRDEEKTFKGYQMASYLQQN